MKQLLVYLSLCYSLPVTNSDPEPQLTFDYGDYAVYAEFQSIGIDGLDAIKT